ncbi:MAG: hypothetical protein IJ860_05735 [Eubacterium sp.]|nr:hypothetical protein [Eubacterium sp.]
MLIYEWTIKGNRICGFIEGSTRYPDGTYIETSEMITAAFDGSLFLIRTENSLYECEADEFQGSEEELETFIRRIAHDDTKDQTRQIKGNQSQINGTS